MNSQQPQSDFYSAYPGPISHSPNPTRPGYATVGLPSTLGGRRNHQMAEAVSQVGTASLYADDRFAAFDNTQRFDRGLGAQVGLQNSFNVFGGANQAAWNYTASSASGAATMSGPANDASRLRGANRRPPLHAEWTTPGDAPLGPPGNQNLSFFPQQQHLGNQGLGLPSANSPDPFNVPPPSINLPPSYGGPELRSFNDGKKDMGDLIPTAIVIKNIPFNVRKEYLTSVMIDMHLPQPYAFNYHFDQGVFRGLAFANFQSAQDTALVIERMNGLDIQGRKLRVEYKKMLPEHERERIEREKREKRGQLEEQHRGPAHQISISSMATSSSMQRAPVNERVPGRFDLDLNDPKTLTYYIELYIFRNDDTREVQIFPVSTLPEDRRLIHALAHNMGLEHTSIGEGENRQVHVSKSKFSTSALSSSQQPGVNLEGHPRGLSRAATFDFNDRQHSSVHSVGRGPTLAIPNSPDNVHNMNGLRGVKSFADLRSFSPSPSPSLVSSSAMGGAQSNGHTSTGLPFMPHYPNEGPFGPSLTTPTTPGAVMSQSSTSVDANGLANGLGSLNLGSSSFESRPRETPSAIGAIGSQRPGASANGNRAIPERQPRGPGGDWENPAGFSRGRANGHAQRGSDSSDNTGLASATHGSAALY